MIRNEIFVWIAYDDDKAARVNQRDANECREKCIHFGHLRVHGVVLADELGQLPVVDQTGLRLIQTLHLFEYESKLLGEESDHLQIENVEDQNGVEERPEDQIHVNDANRLEQDVFQVDWHLIRDEKEQNANRNREEEDHRIHGQAQIMVERFHGLPILLVLFFCQTDRLVIVLLLRWHLHRQPYPSPIQLVVSTHVQTIEDHIQ